MTSEMSKMDTLFEIEEADTPGVLRIDRDSSEYFSSAFDTVSNSTCQLDAWRHTGEVNNHELAGQEQTPLSTRYEFSKAFPANFPPTPQGPSQADFNLMFLRANNPEYSDKDFKDTQPAVANLNADNHLTFQQEIESHFLRRRESVRRTATDQAQDYTHNIPTPRLSSTSTSEEPELWSIWQGKMTSLYDTTATSADVPSEHEVQTDTALKFVEDGANEPIKRRPRKRKQRSEADIKAAKDASLLRNRGAASKCRAKKKDWIKDLEDDARVGKLRNDELRLEREDLLAEVDMLRNLVALCQAEDKRPTEAGECIEGENEEVLADRVEERVT